MLTVGRHGARRRLCELPNKSAFDPRLAGDVIAFGDDYSSPNRAIVERCAYGLEVADETRVVRLEAVGAVEAEFAGVEVRVGYPQAPM